MRRPPARGHAPGGGSARPSRSSPPPVPGGPGRGCWNEQLIRYAGYRAPAARVLGDPRYVDFTDTARALGWPRRARRRFDVLPLWSSAAASTRAGPQFYEVPGDAVLEVPLAHPEHPWFADLGLRWHAVPAISNMRLEIGGVTYPAAPFNGWYMGTEIGARNLADTDRYDLLPVIAEAMGLDTSQRPHPLAGPRAGRAEQPPSCTPSTRPA